MKTLLIDTALEGVLVAVGGPEYKILAQEESHEPYGQAEILLPMIARVLDFAGTDYHGLTGVAVTVGPGAFTGLRVGLSAVKAMKLSLNIPTFGVTTFEAVRQTSGITEPAIVLLETKRRDYYVQDPKGGMHVLGAAQILEQWPGVCVIGNAVERLKAEVGVDKFRYVQITRVEASALYACAGNKENMNLEPLYLRGADVTLPKTSNI